MKKEYLILAALILIFSAYLFLHTENKDNYTLPDIKKVDAAQITRLALEKKAGPVHFIKKGSDWVVTDHAYPADASSVQAMLDAVTSFKLSALVSETEDVKRYDLDDENRIRVRAMKEDAVVFEFTMGKTAPTYNHTFVMLAGDKNIYHATGNFRPSFDKTVDDFRNKQVFSFKQDSLKQFSVEKNGVSKTFIARQETDEKKAAATTWETQDKSTVDKEAVLNLLSAISSVECEKFLESPSKKELETQTPACRIHLADEKKLELVLFKGQTEDEWLGISSMNPYGFMLSSYNGKDLVSQVEKLLGIAKPEEKKE